MISEIKKAKNMYVQYLLFLLVNGLGKESKSLHIEKKKKDKNFSKITLAYQVCCLHQEAIICFFQETFVI